MFSELVGEVTGMVVVDKRDRADSRCGVGPLDLVLHQGIANHVADCLGTIDVAFGGNQLVEILQ